MNLHFTKMHGLGNDFVVIDAINQWFQPDASLISHLGDRHLGIGFDQLLLVSPALNNHADFRYRAFNCDGKEAEQCGNGARCLTRFLVEKKLTSKTDIALETTKNIIYAQVMPNSDIMVNMGIPRFLPEQIPFLIPPVAKTTPNTDACNKVYSLEIEGVSYDISVVSIGNPHAIHVVTDIALAPVAELGPKIESHARFPERVNVNFMQIVDPRTIALRVFERGVGETLACGSGACASVVTGIRLGLLDYEVAVHMTGGTLTIRWDGENKPVFMTGPAVVVFEGSITL